jgi:hypothetical protein
MKRRNGEHRIVDGVVQAQQALTGAADAKRSQGK